MNPIPLRSDEGTRGNKSRPELPPSANSCPDYNPPLWFSTGSSPSLAFLYTSGSQPFPICRSHQKNQVGFKLSYIKLQLKKENLLSAAASGVLGFGFSPCCGLHPYSHSRYLWSATSARLKNYHSRSVLTASEDNNPSPLLPFLKPG